MTREDVMEVARAEIGTQEQPRGSNWGPRIKLYLASVGILTPAPWCLAFVHWVFARAAFPGKHPLPHTGYVPLLANWAKQNGRFIPAKKARPGDLVIFYFPSLKRYAHVGIVGQVKPDAVWTIEGNSNDEGSREGWKVVRKLRPLTSRMKFIDMKLED